MRLAFSVILKENCQKFFKRCKFHMHLTGKNELCKFEGGQGYVIVLPLVRKAVKSLPLETLCPFNCPRQTLYQLFVSAESAIIDSFHARRRLIESLFDGFRITSMRSCLIYLPSYISAFRPSLKVQGLHTHTERIKCDFSVM